MSFKEGWFKGDKEKPICYYGICQALATERLTTDRIDWLVCKEHYLDYFKNRRRADYLKMKEIVEFQEMLAGLVEEYDEEGKYTHVITSAREMREKFDSIPPEKTGL